MSRASGIGPLGENVVEYRRRFVRTHIYDGRVLLHMDCIPTVLLYKVFYVLE